MKVELLIVTYLKDLPYLRLCLKSVYKFARGFNAVTLVVPKQEEIDFLDALAADTQFRETCNISLYERVADPAKWHLDSQLQKCLADQHVKGHVEGYPSEAVAFIDSDCVFTKPVTPEDYLHNDKPVLLIEEYKRLRGCPWRGPTERALGFACPYETMRRHPAVHWLAMFKDFRERVEWMHSCPFRDYVLKQNPTFPWGFSEFNALGSFVLFSREWHPRYHFIDVATQPWPEHKLMQFWSHSPPDREQDLPSGGRATPLEFCRKAGIC